MKGAARDLPWRSRRDPYAVWVSEIMLQQTQVATVTPYFERWMERFPTVELLATAHPDDVLKAWEGLGYYARARNLKRAAEVVMERHGGVLPSSHAELLRLPGIGRYTAGAILSLAFGQPAPILDGNVRRVLSRVYDIAGDPGAPATEARLWELSGALVGAAPDGQAGDLNEALMELGALVCTPASPQCPLCPLKDVCLALVRGTISERPVRKARAAQPLFDVTAGVVRDSFGRYLLIQRPPNGLLGGLWGFPGGTVALGETPERAVARTIEKQTGVEVQAANLLPTVKHAYTHFRITLHPFLCRFIRGAAVPLGCAAARWVTAGQLEQYALPVTDRKVWSSARAATEAGPGSSTPPG